MLAVGLVAAVASVTWPAQFRAFDREEQVLGSDLVVLGRVVETRALREPPDEAIFTEAELLVEEVWKGSPAGDVIRLRTPGGELDGLGVEVDGAATFVAGERVLVFLRAGRDGRFEPWGMRFGKYGIEETVEPPFALGALPTASEASARFEAVSQSLEDLEREVRDILEADAR